VPMGGLSEAPDGCGAAAGAGPGEAFWQALDGGQAGWGHDADWQAGPEAPLCDPPLLARLERLRLVTDELLLNVL